METCVTLHFTAREIASFKRNQEEGTVTLFFHDASSPAVVDYNFLDLYPQPITGYFLEYPDGDYGWAPRVMIEKARKAHGAPVDMNDGTASYIAIRRRGRGSNDESMSTIGFHETAMAWANEQFDKRRATEVLIAKVQQVAKPSSPPISVEPYIPNITRHTTAAVAKQAPTQDDDEEYDD